MFLMADIMNYTKAVTNASGLGQSHVIHKMS